MLLSAVNIAGSVCEESVYDPWNLILPEGYGAIADGLKKAHDVVVVQRKDARDASQKWFGVASVESTVVGESSVQRGVRISNIDEVGEVKYLPQSVAAPQIASTSYSAKSPAKGKRKKSETPAPVAIKRQFEFDEESVELPKGQGVYFEGPNFAIALKDQDKTASSHRTGRILRAAPVFQSSPC